MNVLGKNILNDFLKTHAIATSSIQAWLSEVENKKWNNTVDIRERFASASFLSDNVVIFNIKGNSFRLEVSVAFESKTVMIMWIGTHAEYDKRNKKR